MHLNSGEANGKESAKRNGNPRSLARTSEATVS